MRTTHLAIVRINLVKPGETRSSPDLKKKEKQRDGEKSEGNRNGVASTAENELQKRLVLR